ncbi:MAG: hypothetical protein WC464_01630 [Bdellovibrionales bacterium]
MTKQLVAIGIPSGDTVCADFAMSLAMLCMSPVPPVALVNAKSSLVPLGRNQCVNAAQTMKASHLLFLDSDIVFPADALKRLMAHGKDIVGASYSKRAAPFYPLTILENGEHEHVTSGLQRVNLLPTGCLLIRMTVFDALKPPFFNLETEGGQLRGEDYYFCEKARMAGFELWCDGDLSSQLGHIGQKVYRIGD